MPNKKKAKTYRKAVIVLLIFFTILLGVIGIRLWKYLSIGVQVVTNNKIELKQSEAKRINLLLLGVGGGTHEGPDLTDTIIFSSIDPATKQALLVSIPRDFWIPELDAKINAAYANGEEKQKGKGLLLVSTVVEKVTGQQVDYALKIDFNGFVKAVDMIGGLSIDVDNTFDDYAYPLTGLEDDLCGHLDTEVATLSAQIATGSATGLEVFPCRYEHLHFDEGAAHMDGITALKYVRSRHALGVEGSDFARSKRQEKVITSFKDKIFSLDVLLNPVKALSLIDVVKDSIDTDIKEDEYDDFIRLAQKMKDTKVKSAVLNFENEETDTSGLLVNPPISEEFRNQWVIVPRAGTDDYSEIHEYIACMIKSVKECRIN